jgi:hypothetical protein
MKAFTPAKQWVVLISFFAAFFVADHFDLFGKMGAAYGNHFGQPVVPIEFSVRDGLIGKVAVFHNISSKTLSVKVVFKNSTFHQFKECDLVFEQGDTKEIGWAEGWKLVPGETVTLSSEGYRTREITMGKL